MIAPPLRRQLNSTKRLNQPSGMIARQSLKPRHQEQPRAARPKEILPVVDCDEPGRSPSAHIGFDLRLPSMLDSQLPARRLRPHADGTKALRADADSRPSRRIARSMK